MNARRTAAVFALLVAVVGSSAGCKSTAAEFEIVCNGEQLSGAANEADPGMKLAKIMGYWEEHLRKGGEARGVVEAVGNVAAADRGRILAQAALEGGYTGPCPIANVFK